MQKMTTVYAIHYTIHYYIFRLNLMVERCRKYVQSRSRFKLIISARFSSLPNLYPRSCMFSMGSQMLVCLFPFLNICEVFTSESSWNPRNHDSAALMRSEVSNVYLNRFLWNKSRFEERIFPFRIEKISRLP